MKKKWEIDRRFFLRGSGTLIGLPFLEAMMPSIARAAAISGPPKRFLAWRFPDGIVHDGWNPSSTGKNYQSTQCLQPLATLGVKSDVTVVTGLTGHKSHHYHCGPAWLSGGASQPNKIQVLKGKTIDQYIADIIGQTKNASLALATKHRHVFSECCGGYSYAYAKYISWKSDNEPIPNIENPQLIFDKLFSGIDVTRDIASVNKRIIMQKSVLDVVVADINSLKSKLGQVDKITLDSYLSGIRDIEMQLPDMSKDPVEVTCQLPSRPGKIYPNINDSTFVQSKSAELAQYYEANLDIVLNMIVKAFECDSTRVVTLMPRASGCELTLPEAMPANHAARVLSNHECSHYKGHDGGPNTAVSTNAAKEGSRYIKTWYVKKYAEFVKRIKNIREGDASMLDNTIIYMGSEFGDGRAHNNTDMPVLLAGNGGTGMETGHHRNFAGQDIEKLYLDIMRSYGVTKSTLGSNNISGTLGMF